MRKQTCTYTDKCFNYDYMIKVDGFHLPIAAILKHINE